MIKDEIKNLMKKVLSRMLKPEEDGIDYVIECPANQEMGEYSTNVAMKFFAYLRSDFKKATGFKSSPRVNADYDSGHFEWNSPRECAESIKKEILKNKPDFLDDVQVAGPGFINFFLADKYLQNQLIEILKQKNKFGDLEKKNKKINVEFISANPTGPLTLGNGRGGFCGDVLSNVFKKAGYEVCKEYYINDTGNQIKVLGHSVIGDEQAEYKGNYIEELRKKINEKSPEKVGELAAGLILKNSIKPSVKKMGINFDKWFSEKNLYENKEVDKAIEELKKRGFTYESEGAVWFKSKDLEDDKDRVLIRADEIRTYFASDVAYLKNKFDRKFDELIFFVGADHHGYVARLKAAASALGYDKEKIDVVVMQLVKLFENGKEVRMSKRAGTYVIIDELIDEVGLDVSRFFFLSISPNTHMNFNLDLAKEKSEKNPVFKIQYAYARICSILRKKKIIFAKLNVELLKEKSELELLKELVKFPEIVEDIAKDYQLQRLPQYATELAGAFHKFYENCKVISSDKNLTKARLSLVLSTKIVLKNVLDLMGLSAPEKM